MFSFSLSVLFFLLELLVNLPKEYNSKLKTYFNIVGGKAL